MVNWALYKEKKKINHMVKKRPHKAEKAPPPQSKQ